MPLTGPGELDPNTSFRVTVGIRPLTPAVDSDPDVGLSDGVTNNRFRIHDKHNYGIHSSCYPIDSSSRDERLTSSSTPQAMQYVMMFEPLHRYGACYTAQESGHVNTGTFINQLDISNGVDLIVIRNDAHEVYDFLYFIVEKI